MTTPFVIDIEDTEEDGLLACGWSIDLDRQPVVYKHVNPSTVDILADPNIATVCHSKHDVKRLRQFGYEVNGPIWDTMVMAWVLNENTPLDLEYCAKRYCNITMDKRISTVDGKPVFRRDDGVKVPLKDAPWPQLRDYNKGDVAATVALFKELQGRLKASPWQGDASFWDYFIEEQVPFTDLLVRMEEAGIPIDLKEVEKAKSVLMQKAVNQETKLNDMVGYPIKIGKTGSTDEVQEYLYNRIWYQPDVVPHKEDLRKSTIVAKLAKKYDLPKTKVTQGMIDGYKDAAVEANTPPHFTVKKVTHSNLIGHYTRKGRGLYKVWTENDKGEKVLTIATPDLIYNHPDDEFIHELIKYRKLQKVVTTYLETYPKYTGEDGRLRGSFKQTGTKTGRLSSARPNLQNQPARGELGHLIRSLFGNGLVIGDYSQLEPRLMAHYSQDPVLLDTYRNNKDIYLVTAAGLFGGKPEDYNGKKEIRDLSKTVFLGTGYDAGWQKLLMILALYGFPFKRMQDLLDLPPSTTQRDLATDFLRGLERTYHVHYAWKDSVKKQAHRDGYVTTIDGHKRRLRHNLGGNRKERGYGERQAVNAKIQGSAGDVVRRAMLAADEYFPQLRTLVQVHDEVLWDWYRSTPISEIRKLLPDLKATMENQHGFDISVPLVFEPAIANTWAGKGGGEDIIIEEA